MSEKTHKHKHHRQHPGEIDINLDSKNPKLKPLLDQLNPILKKVIEAVKTIPEEERECANGGYHNITFCGHDEDDECK